MAARGFLSRDQMTGAQQRPLPVVVPRASKPFQSSAVVEHVLEELKAADADLSIDDLLQGQIQVTSTVDARVQRIVNDAVGARPGALRAATPGRQRGCPGLGRRA